MKRILLSLLPTSLIALFFYLAIWTSTMSLSGKFLMTGFAVAIHFSFGSMIYNFPSKDEFKNKQNI